MAFLGWYDPDKKKMVARKLLEALDRYHEKFGVPATLCLTSPTDAEALVSGDVGDIKVEGRGYISRHIFYVGQDDDDTTDRGVWL
jgi:hypothetical protein